MLLALSLLAIAMYLAALAGGVGVATDDRTPGVFIGGYLMALTVFALVSAIVGLATRSLMSGTMAALIVVTLAAFAIAVLQRLGPKPNAVWDAEADLA